MEKFNDNIKPIEVDSYKGNVVNLNDPMPELIEKEYIMSTGPGLYIFKGPLVQILDVINNEVLKITDSLNAERCEVPTLISWENAKRSEYLKSFSNLALMMKTHEDEHGHFKGIACPSICYHYFSAMHKKTVKSNFCVTVKGCVTRNEKDEKDDLSRLTNFTVRDIVFYGTKEYLTESLSIMKEKATQLFADKFDLSFSVMTANDPFFGNDEEVQEKVEAQLFLQSKYEFQAELPFKGTTLSIGSINNHGQIFYDRFDIKSAEPGLRFSGCVGWGYERILFAILAQKGLDFTTSYYRNLLEENKANNDIKYDLENNEISSFGDGKITCSRCLKTLEEDFDLNGPGYLKVVNKEGVENFMCHTCFKGY